MGLFELQILEVVNAKPLEMNSNFKRKRHKADIEVELRK
jgi:hypothetical protein